MPLLRIEPANDIDVEHHLLLDKRVNDSVRREGFGETLKPGECVTLLCTIVTCSDGILDSEYNDRSSAYALIEEHSELTNELTAAWTSKSYRDIRNLDILQVKVKMPLPPDNDISAKDLSLDKRVNDSVRCEGFGETLRRAECITLLCAIVTCSDGILDSQYNDRSSAYALIEKYSKLMYMLINAWRSKSYRKIRKLPILQARNTSDGGPLTEKMKAELGLSLTKPYHGAAVDAFYEYLEQNQKDFTGAIKYYARYCSIVQSSGTGKTRLMLELAKKGVLVLYINLRPKDDRTGFPLRDSIPADILTGDLNKISAHHYEARCDAFLASVFKTIPEVLSVYVQQGCPDPIKQWNDRMCDLSSPHRTQFFERLLDVYNEVYKSIPQSDKTAETKEGGGDEVTASMARLSVQESSGDLMKAAYSAMITSLPWLFTKDSKPKLALALDEAHPLHEKTTFHPATILCRSISTYSGKSEHAVWVVFASTTSKVAHFAPPRDKSNSARVAEGGELVFAPFSQLGWDQHAEPLNAIPATDVAKLGHIIGYGRSLWTSLKAVFDTHAELFDVARDKLCGLKAYDPTIQNQALAFLDQRFGLDICFGHRHAVEHVESSVASHLCVCITTTEDRAWSYTTYPSEPFLSVIAANLLHRTDTSLQQILAILKAKVDDGMIDIGQSGELASRLLWLLAKDLFVRIGQSESSRKNPLIGGDSEAKDWDAELIDCKMVSVTEFFEFLFGEDFWSRAPTGAKTAFQDAYVNFSHWVSMDVNIRRDDEDQLDFTEWTSRHWQRTCAVQCCHNQPSIDKVIPIYFKSRNDDSTDRHRFSQILISDKARKQATTTALQSIMRTDPSIAGPEFKSPLPYIAILADMGLDQPGWRDSDVSFPQRTSGRVESDGQCLRIHARGIDPKTYAFLGGTDSALLDALRHLVEREKVPGARRPLAQYVQDQVRYGNSGSKRHMHWERGSAPAPQQR